MKDVKVEFIKSGVCYVIVSINGREHKINSTYSLLEKIYDEMYGTELPFDGIVKKYLSQLEDGGKLLEHKRTIENKLS